MSKFEYIGRQAKFVGKSLPQICLRLKDFGIGRMFTRGLKKRNYPEVCYYVLTKFEPNLKDEYMREGNYEADVVFRGGKYGRMPIPGWKEDFQLVPKEEEAYYLSKTLPDGQRWRAPTEVPKFVDLPPLIKEMLKQEAAEKKITVREDELKLPFIINTTSPFSLAKYK